MSVEYEALVPGELSTLYPNVKQGECQKRKELINETKTNT